MPFCGSSGSKNTIQSRLFAQLEARAFLSGKAVGVAAHYRDMLVSYKVEDCLI